jgi:hypothetical protein
MINYKAKYIKYKKKYMDLKNQLGGEFDYSQYLYHGTSSVYLPYIKKNGIGIFPQDLYEKMKTIYNLGNVKHDSLNMIDPLEKEERKAISETVFNQLDDLFFINGSYGINAYIEAFFDNDNKKNASVYFTKDIEQAKRYGVDGNIGKDPDYFLDVLKIWHEKNIKNEDKNKTDEIKKVIELLAILDPPDKKQIILAIKSDQPEVKSNPDDIAYQIKRQFLPKDLFLFNEGDESTGVEPSVTPI